MDWFLIFVSIAVVWVASLFKILHSSFYPYRSSFLHNEGGGFRKRNVMVVTAHPDDESMFFSLTINYLTSGHNVHILCMSTGNAGGMGDVRKEELYMASAMLKVPLQQVKILDHPDLQDGFGKVWNSSLVAKIVEEKVVAHAIEIIITFDNYGVSGHCNHRDVNHGVRRFLLDNSQREVEAWELVSTNILRKYTGPVDVWFSLWTVQRSPNGQMHCLLNESPRRTYIALSQHLSQMVWFRKLFVSFSSYTYINTLRKINK